MITLEAKIKDTSFFDDLRCLNGFLSGVRNQIFVDLFARKTPYPEAKNKSGSLGISHRHFTSVATGVKGTVRSIEEKRNADITNTMTAICQTKKTIKKHDSKIKQLKKNASEIEAHRDKVKIYKKNLDEQADKAKKKTKQPKLKLTLKKLCLSSLRGELKQNKFILHQKKRRLNILESKLEKLKSDQKSKKNLIVLWLFKTTKEATLSRFKWI